MISDQENLHKSPSQMKVTLFPVPETAFSCQRTLSFLPACLPAFLPFLFFLPLSLFLFFPFFFFFPSSRQSAESLLEMSSFPPRRPCFFNIHLAWWTCFTLLACTWLPHMQTSSSALLLCWTRTGCSLTTEASSVPVRCSFFPPDSGCCKLLSLALVSHPSFLDWDPLPLLPWSCQSPAPLPASLNRALWLRMSATSQLLSSSLARQGSHHGTVWGIDGSRWGGERRGKAGLYCLAACWVKPVGLKRKRKGKGLLSLSPPPQFSLCAFKQWRSKLNVGISSVRYHVPPGKGTPGESLRMAHAPCWSHCSTLSGAACHG